MARQFTAANSEFLRAASTPVTVPPFTLSCWVYPNDADTLFAPMALGTSAQQYHSLLLRGADAGDFLAAATHAGGLSQAVTTNGFTANAWNHCLGIWTSATDRVAVLNGDFASKGSNTTSRVPTTPTLIDIGRRQHSVPSNLDGRAAEAAIWNVVLTQEEGEALNAGYSPLFIRPASLVVYVPAFRGTGAGGNEIDRMAGLSFVDNNTVTVAEHVPTIYPSPPHVITAPVVAAPGDIVVLRRRMEAA